MVSAQEVRITGISSFFIVTTVHYRMSWYSTSAPPSLSVARPLLFPVMHDLCGTGWHDLGVRSMFRFLESI